MKRRSAQVSSQPAPARRKLHLSLPTDVHARLSAFAGYHHLDISEVVAQAVQAHMAGFTVYQRGSESSPASAPPAPPEAETVPFAVAG